jgi:hypothetical protein
MNLEEYCDSITKEELFKIAVKVCEAALPIWREYSANNELTYRDTVVGLHHNVDANLLQNSISVCKNETFESAIGKSILIQLLKDFSDPIFALQNADWGLPNTVEEFFYAIYNLLNGLRNRENHKGELIHYISVNQAAGALTESGLLSFEEIRRLIYANPIK